jgi:hypothetical protein
MKKPKIVVFAGNYCRKDKEDFYFSLAYQTGKLLARNGFTTVTGGGPGLMDKVSEGAYKAGGETIGICLDIKDRKNSEFLTVKEFYTDLLKRQIRLFNLADGFIALPGGVGTLFEISQLLAQKRKKEIPFNIPLILVSDFFQRFEDLINMYIEEGFVLNDLKNLYECAKTPVSAVHHLEKLLHSKVSK